MMMKKEEVLYVSYPAISRLVHVALDLAGVRHQVLHSPVFQCCGVWGGEYGLYTVERPHNNQNSLTVVQEVCDASLSVAGLTVCAPGGCAGPE